MGNSNLVAGTQFEMSCDVTDEGNPEGPAISWYENGSLMVGESSPVLRVTPTLGDDGKTFQCKADNGIEASSSLMTISLSSKILWFTWLTISNED